MTEINDRFLTVVAVPDANNFTVNFDSRNAGAFTGDTGGQVNSRRAARRSPPPPPATPPRRPLRRRPDDRLGELGQLRQLRRRANPTPPTSDRVRHPLMPVYRVYHRPDRSTPTSCPTSTSSRRRTSSISRTRITCRPRSFGTPIPIGSSPTSPSARRSPAPAGINGTATVRPTPTRQRRQLLFPAARDLCRHRLQRDHRAGEPRVADVALTNDLAQAQLQHADLGRGQRGDRLPHLQERQPRRATAMSGPPIS
jgi:hypothetical protein